MKCGNIRQTQRGVCNSVGKSALIPLFIADYSSTAVFYCCILLGRLVLLTTALLLCSTWEACIADYSSTAVFCLGGLYC